MHSLFAFFIVFTRSCILCFVCLCVSLMGWVNSIVSFFSLKRFFSLLLLCVYIASHFSEATYYNQVAQVYAQDITQKVDLVAMFVDRSIYDAVQWDLQWYTTQYIPQQAPWTKVLVFPIAVDWFQAQDIQHILQNLHHDGQQDIASQLAWVMLLGDIPLPIVELEERRFASVYPYVDFDDPMFVYDPVQDIFVYNDFPDSLPEAWHSVLPSTDPSFYVSFFEKLRSYAWAPEEYAKADIWVEDFTFMKEAYTEEEIDKYINMLVFSEADEYRRTTTVYSKLLAEEYDQDIAEAVNQAKDAMDKRAAQIPGHESIEGDENVGAAADKIVSETEKTVEQISAERLLAAQGDIADKPVPTLLLEKTMESNLDSNHVIFGDWYLSELQENILAWWRYQLEDIDMASEKIAFRDTVARQYLEDINTILEEAIDTQIYNEEYFLKYPLPYLYIIRTPPWFAPWAITTCVEEEKTVLYERNEVFYKGRNAVDVLEYPDLSITRGTYLNIEDIDTLLWSPLAPNGFDQLEDVPSFDPQAISVGAWYGWHSQQVEQNRAFNFDQTLFDKELYDTRKCGDEDVDQFSYEFWGWASPMNIDFPTIQSKPKSPDTKPELTNYEYGRHPSVDRRVGWPWYDVAGTVLVDEEVDVNQLDRYAHHDNATVIKVDPGVIDTWRGHCIDRQELILDEMPVYTPYEELEFFDSKGDFFDGWGIYKNQVPDGWYPEYNNPIYPWSTERITLTVHSPTWMFRDLDEDRILNKDDTDIDNDGIPDWSDPDIDNDKLLNGEDYDIDDDGPLYWNGDTDRLDFDMDKDGIPNDQDSDMNNDGEPNAIDDNVDSDWQFMYKHHELENAKDPDIDGDGVMNWYDEDMDGDGTPNAWDNDMDGDGIINDQDSDHNADWKYPKEKTAETLAWSQWSSRKEPTLWFNQEIRDSEGDCVYIHRYYWYQLINTVTKHASPDNEELDEMHPMTLERPIDDPRYTTFMALDGDLKKFIYPDMYRVNIFAWGTLLKPEQIEQNIQQYLREKIQVYNQHLDIALSGAPAYYALHQEAYDFLAVADPAASPNRSYELFPESFLIDQIGELNIKRIAEHLYHLNVAWKDQRPQGATVWAYVESARELFDYNNKVEYILDEYVQYDDPADLFAFDHTAYPTHIEPTLAYEVGVISSNGMDLVKEQDVGTDNDDLSPNDLNQNTSVDTWDSNHPDTKKIIEQWIEDDTVCNIPRSWYVPLLKWPKAVTCWWKKTIEKPVSFEFTAEIHREAVQDLYDWWWQYKEWLDKAKWGLWIDGQRWWFFFDTALAQEWSALSEGSVYVDVDSYMYAVDDEKQTWNIIVWAVRDVGVLSMDIRVGGDLCVELNGTQLCPKDPPKNIPVSPYEARADIPFSFIDDTAWAFSFDISLCSADGQCIDKDIALYRSPGPIAEIVFQTVTDRTVAGTQVPFRVFWKDIYQNDIDILPLPYVATVSQWSFVWSNTQQESLFRLEDAYFSIDTSGLNPWDDVVITLRPDVQNPDPGLPTLTHTIDIVESVLRTQDVQWNDIETFSLRLPSKDEWIYEPLPNGASSLRESVMQQVRFLIQDTQWNPLLIPVQIRTEQWRIASWRSVYQEIEVSPWDIREQHVFIQEDTFFPLPWAELVVTFVPTWEAGEDVIRIGIWEQVYTIPMTILPHAPENLVLNIDAGKAMPWDVVNVTARVYDSRWNIYTEPAVLDFEALGWREPNQDTRNLAFEEWELSFSWTVTTWWSCWGKWRCRASWYVWERSDSPWNENEWENDVWWFAWYTSDWVEVYGDTQQKHSFSTPDVLWPYQALSEQDDLNIMYLSLFGQSWWNYHEIPAMLANSKTLAITTQYDILWSAKQQPQVKMLMHNDWRIRDPWWIVKEMIVTSRAISVLLWNQGGIWSVDIGTWQDFVYQDTATDAFFNDRSDTADNQQGRIVYTPLIVDGAFEENVFEDGQIRIDDLVLVDVVRWTMDKDTLIRFANANSWDLWYVTYKNTHVGTLRIQRTWEYSTDVFLLDPRYQETIAPFGGSSNSDEALAIVLEKTDQVAWSVSIFDSLEVAHDAREHVWFRHNFANVTNFSQWMTVGESSKHFGGPFVINYGDPFLKRIQKNRAVLETDYDDGIGKLIFSDTERILDADMLDADNDGRKDLVVSYKDGSLRILKNYGWEQPFLDVWTLLVVSDGIKETFIGDVDGDGWEDIMILTTSEKLRAYMNRQGVFDVDGTPVCLNVPLGHKNVAQVKQLFAEYIDDDTYLDIVTNDIDGAIKVFYWWSDDQGPNYLSLDPLSCDDDWKQRQQDDMVLVKQYDTSLWWPVSGDGLRHWPGLVVEEGDPSQEQYAWWNETSYPSLDFKWMSKAEIEAFTQQISRTEIDKARAIDPRALTQDALSKIDLALQLPENFKPEKYRDDDTMAAIRASDPTPPGQWYEVSKEYTDLNGGNLVKWDIVRVTVSLIPTWTTGPIMYWEKIDGPWIVYVDEYGKIDPFDRGNIPESATIDRNISNGYDFLLYDAPLQDTLTFGYDIQYNGYGYVHIDVETVKKHLYKWPTNASIASRVWAPVYAQSETRSWDKRIRAYPDDGCYDQYSVFTPDEQVIDLSAWRQAKQQEYENHFEEWREDVYEQLEVNFLLEQLKKQLGLKDSLERRMFEQRAQHIMAASNPEYLDYFVQEFEQKIDNYSQRAIGYAVDKLGVFEDYEFGYQKCGGIKFGSKMCGQWIPMPFNMAFLSPGTFNVMWCKLMDDPWFPIFAVPTSPVVPIRPPNPAWIKTLSQFRIYLSPTLTNGLWLGLCFGPRELWMNIKSPVWDFVGNCLVIAWAPLIASECIGDDTLPVKETYGDTMDADYVLTPEQYDLMQSWVCDPKKHANSPFYSTHLQWSVALAGTPQRIQSTTSEIAWRDWTVESYDQDINNEFTLDVEWENLFSIEKERLQWWKSFTLQVEWGNVRWLSQCLVRKWWEKQMRYIANNAMSMHMSIILPRLDWFGEEWDKITWFGSNVSSIEWGTVDTFKQLKSVKTAGTAKEINTEQSTWRKRAVPTALGRAANGWEISRNVFKDMEYFFEQVPLVNIDYQITNLEVPWIPQGDKLRYIAYLENWIERNKDIMQQWKNIVQYVDYADVENSLEWFEDFTELEKENFFKDLVETIADLEFVVDGVEKNLGVIKQYENMWPKLAAWAHSADQYVIEIVDFLDTFLSEITAWLQDNAQRFSKRVDTISLIIGIIETWQILIDFSVNWHSKCAECKQDNYDFYSCKLSMLCPDLPVLPIPNFHIPNIFIDFSNISLWLDVVLPDVRFVPKKLPLPTLPDLPTPDVLSLWLNFTLPEIPVLPPPPALPALPELDLDIEMTLPTLPPAPKVPKISPAIKRVVELSDLLGTFLCLLKSDIGLVAEQWLKTRIEQMTQRKMDLSPFDSIRITLPESPIAGVDYEISSYLDLKADFSELYNAVDWAVQWWNSVLNVWYDAVQNKVTNPMSKRSRIVEEVLETGVSFDDGELWETAWDWLEEWLPEGLAKPREWYRDTYWFLPSSYTTTRQPQWSVAEKLQKKLSQYKWWTYEEVYSSLYDELAYLVQREDLAWLHTDALSVLALLETPSQVRPHYEGVEKIRETVSKDLQYIRQQYQSLQKDVEDFDAFMESLPSYALISGPQGKKTYSTSLFEANDTVVNKIRQQKHPQHQYITMQQWLVDGFAHALEANTHYELGMDRLAYEDTKHYFTSLRQKMHALSSDISNHQQIRLAQTPSSQNSSYTNTSIPLSSTLDTIDFTQFINGFFVPWRDQQFHNVISWREKGDALYKENRYHIDDINNDGVQDIFLYDDYHIRMKYGQQNDIHPWASYNSYIEIWPFVAMEQLKQQVEEDYGWYEADGTAFKIWDQQHTDTTFARAGHNFSSMSWEWDHKQDVAWYILEVTHKPWVNFDKSWWSTDLLDPNRTRYVLVLPESTSAEWLDLMLPGQLEQWSVEDYIEDDVIMAVVYYDGQAPLAKAMLYDLPQERHYARAASLTMVTQEKNRGGVLWRLLGVKNTVTSYVLEKNSSRSRQALAWSQAWWDDQAPTLTVRLIRNINNEEVSIGNILQWNINTNYTIQGQWEDNGEVLENWILRSGSIVAVEDGSGIVLDDLDYPYPHEEIFTFVAVDQAGNTAREKVKLLIDVPELTIEEINYIWSSADIHTSLSDTIDRGQVKFEKNRLWYREPLDPDTFATKPLDPLVVWWLYIFDDRIYLYDTSWATVCSVDTKTWEIVPTSENIDVDVYFADDGYAHVRIAQQQGNMEQSLFDVRLLWKEIVDPVQIRTWWYETIALDTDRAWAFAWWICIQPTWDECHIFVSRTWDMYVPSPFSSRYNAEYAFEDSHVHLTIVDERWRNIADYGFIIEPFE